jgi:bifunctional DNA-binding transcriptional regulator/antitoxin component of YhaV-PrlF toxin-antitoxin module
MIPTIRWRILIAGLKEAWPTWLWLAGILVAFAVGRLWSTRLSDVVRYAGAMLQVLGLATVAWGLSEMRRLFHRPSLRARIFGWFRRLAAAFRAPKLISGQASVAGRATVSAEARVVLGVRPGAPLEERVKVLEENLNRLRDEQDTKVQEIRRELSTVREDMQRESQERQAADEKTVRQIEEVAIGGLHLEIVGLFWLFLGVLCTSIPNEIAWPFGG